VEALTSGSGAVGSAESGFWGKSAGVVVEKGFGGVVAGGGYAWLRVVTCGYA
jgi:hypothetical protein